MEHDRQNFWSFWAIFYPFPQTKKSKFLKNELKKKNAWRYLSFYTCVPQIMIIRCMVPEIWSATDIFFYNFGPPFALLPTNNPEN